MPLTNGSWKKEFLNESVQQWYVGISSKFRVLYEWDS